MVAFLFVYLFFLFCLVGSLLYLISCAYMETSIQFVTGCDYRYGDIDVFNYWRYGIISIPKDPSNHGFLDRYCMNLIHYLGRPAGKYYSSRTGICVTIACWFFCTSAMFINDFLVHAFATLLINKRIELLLNSANRSFFNQSCCFL